MPFTVYGKCTFCSPYLSAFINKFIIQWVNLRMFVLIASVHRYCTRKFTPETNKTFPEKCGCPD